MMSIEEEHEDVLQNIEFMVIHHFRSHPELMDYQVQAVYEELIRVFSGEVTGRKKQPGKLSEQERELLERVKAGCDWRLGRVGSLFADEKRSEPKQSLFARLFGRKESVPQEPDSVPETIDVQTMVACLKRLKRSVEKWNKQGGQRGYLTFISRFV